MACLAVSVTGAVELQQNIRFEHLGLEDGLTQESVYDIIQDSDGMIWMATQEGLNRYDGYDITAFLHDPEDTGSLSHDWVWTVMEDSKGNLWVGTDGGGLNRYDPISGDFEHFRHDPENPRSLAGDEVRAIFEDSDGWIWLGTDSGLSSYNPESGFFSNFTEDPERGLTSNKVRAILQDRRGLMWIATDGGGLSQLDPARRSFSHYRHDADNPNTVSTNRLRSLFEANDGMIWIGTYDGGVNRFNPRTSRFTRYNTPGSGLVDEVNIAADTGLIDDVIYRDILQDHRGVLWVAADNGLHEYRPESDTFVRYVNDIIDPKSLSSNRVISIIQDSGDVLWVGTYAGVNIWNYQTVAFNLYKSSEDNGLVDDTIASFSEAANGDWWVGTYDGLYYYERESGNFNRFGLRDSDLLEAHPATAVAVGDGGEVWIGTQTRGLIRVDTGTGEWVHYDANKEDPNALQNPGITNLRYAAGNLWVATWGGGLHRYQPESDDFRVYRHSPDDAGSLPSDRVVSVAVTQNDEVWVGTFGAGVARLDAAGEGFVRYVQESGNRSSISSNAIWAIHEDASGNLWFGTQGGGLSMLPQNERGSELPKFKRFGRNQGMRSLVVYGVLSDEQGNIWMSSNRGIARLNRSNSRISHYDVHHGLQGYEFNANAFMKTRRGELVFGGSNGFNSFFPSEVRIKDYSPPVLLTNIYKVNEPVTEPASIHELSELVLSAQDYLVTFEFAGLDYATPEGVTYEYMLQGYDQSWIRSATIRRASYTNLPAGDYQFMVRAAGASGNWSDTGVNLPVQVLPPWYLTRMAMAGYIAILVLLAFASFGLHRRRLRMEARRAQLLEKEVDQRTEQLAARSDELEQRNIDLRALNAKLEESSITDTLTGLNNRVFVGEFMQRTTGTLDRRLEKLPLSSIQQNGPRLFMLLVDLDRFREINEEFGSDFGDEVLRATGQCLKGICRGADLAARWGGDQFLMIGETSQTGAISKIAERALRRIAEVDHRPANSPVQHVTASCGLAFYPFSTLQPHLYTWEQVLAIAERAASLSKQAGGGHCVTISSGRQGISRGDLKRILDDPKALEATGAIQIDQSDRVPGPVSLEEVRSELENIRSQS
ncbi:MAG: two-component regulator propeller domain-containing protein [Xanthomonadales bacterium]|nr:two-component regulator propeller domain-containing protein [Xanthomonadales bacterium]